MAEKIVWKTDCKKNVNFSFIIYIYIYYKNVRNRGKLAIQIHTSVQFLYEPDPPVFVQGLVEPLQAVVPDVEGLGTRGG